MYLERTHVQRYTKSHLIPLQVKPYSLIDEERKVIRFDVSKEEFGSTDFPENNGNGLRRYKLVDLHGEVGLVYYYGYLSIEVWVFKQKNGCCIVESNNLNSL